MSFPADMSEVGHFCVPGYLNLFTLLIVDGTLFCYNDFKMYRLHPHTFSFLKYQIVAKHKTQLYHPLLGMAIKYINGG